MKAPPVTERESHNMKNRRIQLLTILTLAGLITVSVGSAAQEKKNEKSQGKSKVEAKQQPNAHRDRLKAVADELNLTEEQKTQLKPVFKEESEKIRALRQDTSLSPVDRRAKVKEIRASIAPKVKKILTTEQFEKWSKIREENQKRRARQ